jgi:hypothetical protein
MRRITIVSCMICMAWGAFAAPPAASFTYKARLTDSADKPISGAHTVFFDVYRGGNSGTRDSGELVYSESASVDLVQGEITHTIGTGTRRGGSFDSAALRFMGDIFAQVAVDDPGNVILPRTLLDSSTPAPASVKAADTRVVVTSPASLFGIFGGSGVDGDRVVTGTENLGAVRREYMNLTVPAGATLVADQGWAYIAVKGKCTIAGTVTADGKGESGGYFGMRNGFSAAGAPSGYYRVPWCASGAGGGGGGGGVNSPSGYYGGGAQIEGGYGGEKASSGSPPLASIRNRVLAGGVSTASGSGQTVTSSFANLLVMRGAGGGSAYGTGVGSGYGGRGGGVVYIECEDLEFTGELAANGATGFPGLYAPASGGGGGGGGGVILVRAHTLSANSGTVSVAAGKGGEPYGSAFPGGDGGPGFWDIVAIP